MDTTHKYPSDIRLFLSPIHRLVNTFVPDQLKSHFGIESNKSLFAFGNGDLNHHVLRSTDDFTHHIEHLTPGTHLLDFSNLDLTKIVQASVEGGMAVTDGVASIDHDGKQITFKIDTSLLNQAEHLTQQLQNITSLRL